MRLYFTLAILLAMLAGCKKDNEQDNSPSNSGIVGRWKYTERFVSPGSGGSWNAVPVANQAVIEFTMDGKFTYSANFEKASSEFDHYTLDGNTKVIVTSATTGKTETWYISHLDEKRLDMSVTMCFEGCAARFVAY